MSLALARATEAAPARPPRLSLVKPERRPTARDLRAAWVLSTFSDWLSLNLSDARALEKAFGWSAETALALGVRSVPSRVEALVLASELRALVGESVAWPAGFYTDPASGALRFDCERRYGLILTAWRRWPVGLQFYRHAKEERPTWISSASRETGAAAAASVHCQAAGVVPAEVERVFVVGHTLAAMAVALKHGVSAVGYNGAPVGIAPAQMFEAFPRLRGVVLAMADPPPRLEGELRDAGLEVGIWAGGELV